ncbi:unnamed protein product, partial [Discosporangium mesarthrocarpum]
MDASSPEIASALFGTRRETALGSVETRRGGAGVVRNKPARNEGNRGRQANRIGDENNVGGAGSDSALDSSPFLRSPLIFHSVETRAEHEHSHHATTREAHFGDDWVFDSTHNEENCCIEGAETHPLACVERRS